MINDKYNINNKLAIICNDNFNCAITYYSTMMIFLKSMGSKLLPPLSKERVYNPNYINACRIYETLIKNNVTDHEMISINKKLTKEYEVDSATSKDSICIIIPYHQYISYLSKEHILVESQISKTPKIFAMQDCIVVDDKLFNEPTDKLSPEASSVMGFYKKVNSSRKNKLPFEYLNGKVLYCNDSLELYKIASEYKCVLYDINNPNSETAVGHNNSTITNPFKDCVLNKLY